MTNHVSLRSIAVSHFRAFANRVCLDELETINLLAGPNNAGKSSLLMPLRRLTRLDKRFVPRIGSPDGVAFLGGTHSARWKSGDFRADGTLPVVEILLRVPNPLRAIVSHFWRVPEKPIEIPPNISVPSFGLRLRANSRRGFDIELDDATQQATESVHAQMAHVDRNNISPSECGRLALRYAEHLAARIVHVPTLRKLPLSARAPDPSAYEERCYDGTSLLSDLIGLCLAAEAVVSWWRRALPTFRG